MWKQFLLSSPAHLQALGSRPEVCRAPDFSHPIPPTQAWVALLSCPLWEIHGVARGLLSRHHRLGGRGEVSTEPGGDQS